jgi:hypothetical protein
MRRNFDRTGGVKRRFAATVDAEVRIGGVSTPRTGATVTT